MLLLLLFPSGDPSDRVATLLSAALAQRPGRLPESLFAFQHAPDVKNKKRSQNREHVHSPTHLRVCGMFFSHPPPPRTAHARAISQVCYGSTTAGLEQRDFRFFVPSVQALPCECNALSRSGKGLTCGKMWNVSQPPSSMNQHRSISDLRRLSAPSPSTHGHAISYCHCCWRYRSGVHCRGVMNVRIGLQCAANCGAIASTTASTASPALIIRIRALPACACGPACAHAHMSCGLCQCHCTLSSTSHSMTGRRHLFRALSFPLPAQTVFSCTEHRVDVGMIVLCEGYFTLLIRQCNKSLTCLGYVTAGLCNVCGCLAVCRTFLKETPLQRAMDLVASHRGPLSVKPSAAT